MTSARLKELRELVEENRRLRVTLERMVAADTDALRAQIAVNVELVEENRRLRATLEQMVAPEGKP